MRKQTPQRCIAGFTLLELVIVLSIVACLCAVATPVIATYYCSCSVKTAMYDICQLVREAKGLALASGDAHAVTFSLATGKAALVSGRGADGTWNTDRKSVV